MGKKIHWIVLFSLLLSSIPWWGTWVGTEPMVFGLPLWALVSLGISSVFAIYTAWFIVTQWQDDKEEHG